MTQLNNNKQLDNSTGIGQDNSNKAMQPASETKKTPWHLRFAPGAILRQSGLIAVLAVVAVLTQSPVEKAEAFTLLELEQVISQIRQLASTNSVSTNSLPTFSSLQEGDTIVSMKKKGAKETIAEWLRNIFGGAAGNQLTKQGQTLVAQPAVANTAGKIMAYGGIFISSVSGEKAYWYSTTGKPISSSTIDASNYNRYGQEPTERDYYYYHFSYYKLKWNADDEIWERKPNSNRTRFGTNTRMSIDKINSRYNQGQHGYEYPEHDDYLRGKRGYVIVYGTAKRVDLKHEMKSIITFPLPKARLLKVRASQHGKDKFKPICYAYLSDMTYGANGWTYTERTEPVKHQHKLSATVQTVVDLGDEVVPFLTRLESRTWEKNISTISWETVSATVSSGGTGTTDDGREIDLSGAPVETRIPKQVISTWP